MSRCPWGRGASSFGAATPLPSKKRSLSRYDRSKIFFKTLDQDQTLLQRLILDSRVVIGQFWRNRLFLQDFPGGLDRCGIWARSHFPG
jgi:hypothetical protein